MVILDIKNIDWSDNVNETVEDVLPKLNIDKIIFFKY